MNRSLVLGVFCCLFAAAAPATTYQVMADGSGDYPTIQAALDVADDGDIILLQPGVFTGPGNHNLWFRGNVTLEGTSHGECIIDCQGAPGTTRRGLNLGDETGGVVRHITIANGHAPRGAGVQTGWGSYVFESCRFLNNHATEAGGGWAGVDGSSAAFGNCIFVGNTADEAGGAMAAVAASSVDLLDCTLVLNGAPEGGGVHLLGEGTHARITECIIAWSTEGSAVYEYYADGFTIQCSDLHGNRGGDWVNGANGLGQNGNIDADPLLMDPMAPEPDVRLVLGSPCGTSSSCGSMGAATVQVVASPTYGLAPDGTGMFAHLGAALAGIPDGATILLEDGVYSGEGWDGLAVTNRSFDLASRSGDAEACRLVRPAEREDIVLHLTGDSDHAVGFESIGFERTAGGESLWIDGEVAASVAGCRFMSGEGDESGAPQVKVIGAEVAPARVTFQGCRFEALDDRSGVLYARDWVVSLDDCTALRTGNGIFDCADQIEVIRHHGGHVRDCVLEERGSDLGHMLKVWYHDVDAQPLVVEDSDFLGSEGSMLVFSDVGRSRIQGCRFLENSDWVNSSDDTQVFLSAPNSADPWQQAEVIDCEFNGFGTAGQRLHGGLRVYGNLDVDMERCTFTGILGSNSCAAVYTEYGSRLQASDCTFTSCGADDWSYGGGAYAREGSSASFNCCEFRDNVSYEGAAIGFTEAHVVVTECVIIDNHASSRGGGIHCRSLSGPAILELRRSLIAGNTAESMASGVMVRGDVDVILEECTLSGNEVTDIYSTPDELGQMWVDLEAGNEFIMRRNIIAHAVTSGPVRFDVDDTVISLANNLVWDNAGLDWQGDLAPWEGINGNLHASPVFCDRTDGDYTVHAASPCLPVNNPAGVSVGAYGPGCGDPAVTVDHAPGPGGLILASATPNPFNPRTTLRYELPTASPVSLSIHDLAGRRVRTLIRGAWQQAGTHAVRWNGRDDRGRDLGSGVYLIRLEAGGAVCQGRMTLLR